MLTLRQFIECYIHVFLSSVGLAFIMLLVASVGIMFVYFIGKVLLRWEF